MCMYIQLNCCTHHKDSGPSQLESQPTRNGDVCNNLNIRSNSNGKLEPSGDQTHPCWCPDLQFIIIDMAPVTFIDSCGSKVLERVSITITIKCVLVCNIANVSEPNLVLK